MKDPRSSRRPSSRPWQASPLVALDRLTKAMRVDGRIFAKLDYLVPGFFQEGQAGPPDRRGRPRIRRACPRSERSWNSRQATWGTGLRDRLRGARSSLRRGHVGGQFTGAGAHDAGTRRGGGSGAPDARRQDGKGFRGRRPRACGNSSANASPRRAMPSVLTSSSSGVIQLRTRIRARKFSRRAGERLPASAISSDRVGRLPDAPEHSRRRVLISAALCGRTGRAPRRSAAGTFRNPTTRSKAAATRVPT